MKIMKIAIPFIIGFIGFQLFFHLMLKPDIVETPQPTQISKSDSLQSVVNELTIQLEQKNKEWDKVEEQYRITLFEYEYGLEAIKQTHPSAYKEFHRIIAFKEQYNRVDEEDNNKRLKKYKL